MRRLLSIVLFGLVMMAPVSAQDVGVRYETPQTAVSFAVVDVFLDSGNQVLAAYQFELFDKTGRAKIVGLEGGEHPAFKEPPHYDPAALSKNRVVVAAFSTRKDLPEGKTRVARIHLRIRGDDKPEFETKLQVAASADGKKIRAMIRLVQGEKR